MSYTWSANKFFTMALQRKTYDSTGETYVVKLDAVPYGLTPGEYQIEAILTGSPRVEAKVPFRIEWAY